MGMEDAAPVNETGRILEPLAPELVPHVHAFLHGGRVGQMRLAAGVEEASTRLRMLHDALIAATHGVGSSIYRLAVLSVAVRLQAVVLYETIKAQCSAVAREGGRL